MRPMFYLIGTKDKRWGGPTIGVVVYSQEMEENMRNKMAESLHQGWQLMIQVMDWTELRIFSYHRSKSNTTPIDLRQIALELVTKLGHIRPDQDSIMLREQDKQFRYGQLELRGSESLCWRLEESPEGQEQMFRGTDGYIYDDPHTLCSLYLHKKLDIADHEVRKVEFRADPNTVYEVTLMDEYLWLKACTDWEILMEGIMK